MMCQRPLIRHEGFVAGVYVRRSRAGVGIVALLAAAAACDGTAPPRRSILATIEPSGSGERVPWIAAVGDLDGDRLCDLAIAGHAERRGSSYVVHVRAHSSRDGRELFAHEVRVGSSCLPFAVGDLDRDGIPDVAVTVLLADEVQLLSGRHGALLRTLAGGSDDSGFGRVVRGLDDVDGDGYGDLAVLSSDGLSGAGPTNMRRRVQAFSGRDGRVLWSLEALEGGGCVGVEMRVVPDLDGDGSEDVAYGGEPGFVDVVSGRDGRQIHRIVGDPYDLQFGIRIAAVPDVDGDRTLDLAVSAHDGDRIYSGASGAMLRSTEMAFSGSEIGDVDRDGVVDFIGGTFRGESENLLQHQTRYIRIQSGADGRELATRDIEFDDSLIQPAVIVLGDLDGDAFSDFALPTPDRVYVVSGSRFFFP